MRGCQRTLFRGLSCVFVVYVFRLPQSGKFRFKCPCASRLLRVLLLIGGDGFLPFFRTQGIISAVNSFSRASTVMRPAS
jgi:hypothetical protein